MKTINMDQLIHIAETDFTGVNEEFAVVGADGQVIARVMPNPNRVLNPAQVMKRSNYLLPLAFDVPEDFNDPLPPEIQQYFE